jgi:hypothetical protein
VALNVLIRDRQRHPAALAALHSSAYSETELWLGVTNSTTAMLKLIRILVTAALFSLSAAQAAGQGVPSVADLRKVTDSVMAKVGGGDIEGGLKIMRPLTIIPTAEFDVMLGQVPLQLPGISARFGASMGQEFLKEEKLGDSLVRLIYLHKFERHAMRWIFYCYKGKSGWVINTFRFDDKWQELFSP